MSDYSTQPYVPTPGVYVSVSPGGSRAYASAGFSTEEPIVHRTDKEYISGSPWGVTWSVPQALPTSIDDITREVGLDVYEAMEASDPIIASSLKLLKISTLSGGLQIDSCVKPTPDDEANHPDHDLAEEVAEYNRRLVKNFRRPFEELIYEFFDAWHVGTKLGEHIYEIPEDGPDALKEVLVDIKIKPRRSWRFVVDNFMNCDSIVAFSADGGGIVRVDRSKFAVMTHNPRNSDPRGTSILRSANAAWNMKLLYWPLFYRFICLSASPIPVGTTAPGTHARPANAQDQVYFASRGLPTPDMILPEMDMLRVVQALQGGAGASIPNGASLDYLEANSSGEVFINSVGLLNREMATGILLQTRATLEAEHGSKADSKTGHEVVGLFVQWIQRCTCSFILKEIFYMANIYRFGKAVADRLAPKVILGAPSQDSLIAMMKAIADLERVSWFTDSQRPTLDAELGLPVRKPEEVNRPKPAVLASGDSAGQDGKTLTGQPDQQGDTGIDGGGKEAGKEKKP